MHLCAPSLCVTPILNTSQKLRMSYLRRTIEYPIHDRVTIDRYTPNKCAVTLRTEIQRYVSQSQFAALCALNLSVAAISALHFKACAQITRGRATSKIARERTQSRKPAVGFRSGTRYRSRPTPYDKTPRTHHTQ